MTPPGRVISPARGNNDVMPMTANPADVRACPGCGLSQRVPDVVPPRSRACCARCGATLRQSARAVALGNSRTAAIALAALILYPIAVSMPMLTVRQLGHAHSSSIIQGVVTLLSGGQVIVGIIVLLCSIILPLGKLIALLVMSLMGHRLAHGHRALTYRIIDFTGRWGMLDVLAVAVLVAALKLGNVMDVDPGPAALAFSTCVILSLLATASFDPHQAIYDEASVQPR